MLERLDTIDWSRLSHAYGPASDVPGLLRALAGEDSGARERALDALHGNVWHQGTVYEATAVAVPFLLELAARPGGPDRDRVMLLLGLVSRGQSWHAVHAPSRRAEVERERGWVAAAHAAVVAGADVLLSGLADPVGEVRAAAAYALAGLPERSGQSRPALRSAATAAADPGERAAHGLALAILGELWPPAFAPDPAAALPLARLSALAALTAGGAFPPEDAAELLLDLAAGALDAERLDDHGAP